MTSFINRYYRDELGIYLSSDGLSFDGRQVLWDELGSDIEEANNVKEALEIAKLDWGIEQRPLFMPVSGEYGLCEVPKYWANVRMDTEQILGVVSKRYHILQNSEAFAFADAFKEEGVQFISAGELQGGKLVWLSARLPGEFTILGDIYKTEVLILNAHDGHGAVKVTVMPLRQICSNGLCISLPKVARTWSENHMGRIAAKMDRHKTLERAYRYMHEFEYSLKGYHKQKLKEKDVPQYIEKLLPFEATGGEEHRKNVKAKRDELSYRYFNAPDLQDEPHTAYRFLNAVADYETHRRMNNAGRARLFADILHGRGGLLAKAQELLAAQ